jgi:uncharacterized hydrophobic protein (TIGR00271 family)
VIGQAADGATGGSGAPANGLVDARQSLGPAKLSDLFPEGEAFRGSLRTFVVLLALASFIAAFGLYQDSVASIIGAMVVAPLGGAIMAFGGAIVTARTRWIAITFVQVLLGALMVGAIAYLVSLVIPNIIVLTPSLEARTTPGLLDLGVALTAGAAGAYVAANRTGVDALPGVAIAVSLVPPLATVGICLELGLPDEAMGALLLFLTNFAAITVAACIVFSLAGAAPSRDSLRARRQVRVGFALAVVTLVILAIPLAAHAYRTATSWIRASNGAPVLQAWIGDRDLDVREWEIDGSEVTLLLAGPDAPGDVNELASELAKTYGTPVTLEVEYVESAYEQVVANP